MANHAQTKKRIRQTEAKAEANRVVRSRMRTYVKAAEKAIETGDKDQIKATFTEAMSQLHRAVTKGIVKKSTASRKVSRLAARIKALNEAAQ